MSLRLIEVTAEVGRFEALAAIAAKPPVIGSRAEPEQDGMRTLHMLVGPHERQQLLDKLQASLDGDTNWRIVVLPVEAAIPPPEPSEDEQKLHAQIAAAETREELYAEVERGAQVDIHFLLLVLLSTVVAAIGLIKDSIPVLIGAMVIAPMLGPNLTLILATALGDRDLTRRAIVANAAGVSLGLAVAVIIGMVVPVDMDSEVLINRSEVGLDSIALALASGAAAALSVTTGLSSALVGVMVAVALLPPTAAIGLFVGLWQPHLALGAALLLAINIVCVNLAGQVVFLAKGIKPRTWLEKRSARQSIRITIAFWLICLVVLVGLLLLRA